MIAEALVLAPYAAHSSQSRGRVHSEKPSSARTEYQRDRDRIIHSSAFRRLEYKTQVFVNHEGDLFRTRLTHTLEVSQISRVAASRLNLNSDLAESIALAHDLGHTPFGHAGQSALNECMKAYGGFEHNLQSLRIVDLLEQQYPTFEGLNLTWESREGILKHCSRANALALGELGERFLTGRQPSLEAQLVNIADAIAYSTHDIDDGLRQRYLNHQALAEHVPLYGHFWCEVQAEYPNIAERRQQKEVVRRLIGWFVDDLVVNSAKKIDAIAPANIEAVRDQHEPLVAFSAEGTEAIRQLKRYLMDTLYRHYAVLRVMGRSARLIERLFEAFVAYPELLPPTHQGRIDLYGVHRVASDYIAGMTDRYAEIEFERVVGPAGL